MRKQPALRQSSFTGLNPNDSSNQTAPYAGNTTVQSPIVKYENSLFEESPEVAALLGIDPGK